MNYDNNLEYNEDITVQRYPKVPYFWSIRFSVIMAEDNRVIKCLIPQEVIEDHFYGEIEEFDTEAMAKVEELMDEEILPAVSKAIKQGHIQKKKNDDSTSYLEVELNNDYFLGKDFRR